MKKTLLYTVLPALLLFQACTDNKTPAQDPESTEQLSRPSCLLHYAGKIDALLPAAMAASAAGFSVTEAEVSYMKLSQNTANHTLSYKWRNGRIAERPTLNGQSIRSETKDYISIGNIKERSLEQFRNSYRPPTAAEEAALDRRIEAVHEGASGNERLDAAKRKLDEMNIEEGTRRAVTGDAKSIIRQAARSYSTVTGIGDAASWNSFENSLYVLHGGVQFSLTVNISNNPGHNKEVACKLAQQVIAQCH